MAIQRALISVSDKTGLEEFAKGLHEFGVELISTGGTAAFLKGLGLPVIEISDYTGEPELFEGRLKTLHPMEHVRQAKENGIKPIDLVCVNLYPFEETVAKPDVTLEEAIEKIDIGGPSMLRSAAKNYASVTVVSDPADYARILDEMQTHKGDTTLKTRENLAVKVFMRTSNYDNAITNYLGHQSAESTKGSFCICAPLYQELRYGDNPHQEASLYGSFGDIFNQLQGKERNAWQKAFETDTQAPFGGVIVVNRPMTEGLARVLSAIFTDVIIAPEYDAEARALLQKKKNCRIIRMNTEAWMKARREPIIRSAPGGFMTMKRDTDVMGLDNLEAKVVTKRPPTEEELTAMRFNWRVVKQVHSNAIVFGGTDRTLGIGAGQMSRVDSARIAVWKAGQAGLDLKGSVVASDAMFPFADGLQVAIDAGATACIQPGGSIRDEEVIAAADAAGIAMVFTGHRHFLH